MVKISEIKEAKTTTLSFKMHILTTKKNRYVFRGLAVDTSRAPWEWTLRFSLAWFLMPLMAIASKIAKKEIEI